MPKSYNALGFAQPSVNAEVIAPTASEQGLVVAELSKYIISVFPLLSLPAALAAW
jgi:hypothetical protein